MNKYLTERKRTEQYVNSICKFGYKNYKPNKTLIIKKGLTKPLESNMPDISMIQQNDRQDKKKS